MIFDHSKEMDQLTNKEKTLLGTALIQDVVISGGCDLHIHTHASDGADSSARIVQKAIENKLKCFSVTDHDSIEGVMDVIRILHKLRTIGIICPKFIPGVELSVHDDCEDNNEKEVHILGYFPFGGIENIESFLVAQRNRRNERNANMCELLVKNGFNVTIDELRAEGGSVVGRLHAANIMVRKGYVGSVKEAFREWLGNGKSCYASRIKPTAKEAIECIMSNGGVSVVAHPYLYGWTSGKNEVSSLLINRLLFLKKQGLCGVESFHGEALTNQKLESFAATKTIGLLTTAGSDYHGDNKKGLKMYDGDMKFINSNEIVHISAIIEIEGKFLAIKKLAGLNEGKWCFPGGRKTGMEDNETFLEKTLIAGTGLKIYNIKHYATFFNDINAQKAIYVYYKCECDKNLLEKILSKIESQNLFSLNELSLLPLMTSDAICVDKLREIQLF